MIPASPAIIAPPVKKQRAGNTTDDPIAARTESALNYRSERLHDLAQRYGTATRSQHQLPQQNGIPPPIMKSSIAPPNFRQPGASVRGDHLMEILVRVLTKKLPQSLKCSKHD
jgi:hypothetical protein